MQIITFVLILSLLVLIHELGHFLTAKFFKMRVEEFGIGIPPKAKHLFRKWGVDFTLNWLPIGGFVRLYGEDPGDEAQSNSPEAFFNKPVWQRAVVLFAGVAMNFLLATVLFGAVYSVLGIPTKTDKVNITEVKPGSPAEKVGLKKDEVVISVFKGKEELKFAGVEGFVKTVAGHKGEELTINVLDAGKQISVKVTPRKDPPPGEGALGVVLDDMEMKKYPWYEMPFRGVEVGMREAISWGKMILEQLGVLLKTIVSGKGVPKDVAGPVGIYQASKDIYKFGILAVLQFMGVLSVNLAVLNVMPFPALDGGRIAFLLVEKIVGKKLKNKVEGYVHTAGMIFLLSIMFLITIRDVWRLFVK